MLHCFLILLALVFCLSFQGCASAETAREAQEISVKKAHRTLRVLLYAAHWAAIDIRRDWKLHFVLTACLALGMLLPTLCLGNGNVFVKKLATVPIQGGDGTYVASAEAGYAALREIQQSLVDCGVSPDSLAASARLKCHVERLGVSKRRYVYWITENFWDFEKVLLKEGTLDIFSGGNLCLADESMTETYPGLSVGDTVDISGAAYTVAGIISSLNIRDFLVPLPNDRAEGDLALELLYFHASGSLPEFSQITQALNAAGLSGVQLFSGKAFSGGRLRQGLGQAAAMLLIALSAFCFAAINISLILTGKLTRDKREIGIRMAMGASPGLTFLGLLTENLICYSAGFLLDFGLLWLIIPTVPKELELIMDASVYAAAFFFGAAMVLLITAISAQWLKACKPAALMERVS